MIKRMSPEEIKSLLKRSGYSAMELAIKFGVTEGAVRKWMGGFSRPSGPAQVLLDQLQAEVEAIAPRAESKPRRKEMALAK